MFIARCSTGTIVHPNLFADQGPEFAPQPDRLQVIAGKVVATMHKPSAAQKHFNALMARIHSQQELAAKLHHVLDTHGPAHRQAPHALEGQDQALLKRMVLFLDGRIQASGKSKGLTAKQKQQAIRMLLSLCVQINLPHDADVQAVWARYARVD